MSKTARRTVEKDHGTSHMPFEEFSVETLDNLVKDLEKSKPAGSVVEVSEMTDSHHSPCLQQMQAIVVQTVDPEGNPIQTYSMYQYCSTCKLAVRVL
jgi:hypothetical protein